jgi:hypothetical protein
MDLIFNFDKILTCFCASSSEICIDLILINEITASAKIRLFLRSCPCHLSAYTIERSLINNFWEEYYKANGNIYNQLI